MSVALAFLPNPLGAQAAGDDDAPRVTRVAFNGSRALTRKELLSSIYTQPTRCRGILLKPFCLLSNSSMWERTRRLDSLEVSRDELRLRVRYFQRGYREAQVASRIVPLGSAVEVVFDVQEGPPILIAALHVTQTNPVLSPRQLNRAYLPAAGQPLDLIRLDSGAMRLREMLQGGGYVDAVVDDSVSVADHAATVEIAIEPQRKATLREVVIAGNKRVSESVIRTTLDMRTGDVLATNKVFGAQRNLYQTNFFRLARVTVPTQPDSAKQVEVEVLEAPLRAWSVGGGLNTVDFVQAEVGFSHYNFNGSGALLELQGAFGNLFASQLDGMGVFQDVTPGGFFVGDEAAFTRPTWEASIMVSQPGFLSSYRNTVSASAFTHRRTVPGVAIDLGFGAGASFTRKIEPRSPASVSYRYEITTVEAGDVYYCINYGVCELDLIEPLRAGQRLSPLTLSIFSNRADDPMSPSSGFRLGLDVEHASALTFSGFRYNRVQAEYAQYLSLGARRVLAGRVRAGWVAALRSTGVELGLGQEQGVLHPRKRFYAGGSQSVRGFGENQLGPRILTVSPTALTDTARANCSTTEIADGSCDPNAVSSIDFQPRPLGGRQSLEANLEYRFPLLGNIDGAVFVDAGWVGAGAEPQAPGRSAVTPGLGIRYDSPVGPIRIDLGVRPTTAEELPVVTEIEDANGVRRLVRLTTLKRFDPLEDARGFRKIINRLALHLSIGQAF